MEHIFEMISLLSVTIGLLTALYIFTDTFAGGHRQRMKIMEAVWTLSGLWGGLLTLRAYFTTGRGKKRDMPVSTPGQTEDMQMGMKMNPGMEMKMDMEHGGMETDKYMGMNMPGTPTVAMWKKIGISTLHCGAGCTLADITGEWFTYFIPVRISGSLIAGQWMLDYLLALLIGVLFQYAVIRPISSLSTGKTFLRALKIDFWSLTSWQVGMYGWMAIILLGFNLQLPKNGWEFWFMMQIAMAFGFITAYPVNWLLVKSGIKQVM